MFAYFEHRSNHDASLLENNVPDSIKRYPHGKSMLVVIERFGSYRTTHVED